MSGQAPAGAGDELEAALEPCRRCGGLAGVHWLTCPMLRLAGTR